MLVSALIRIPIRCAVLAHRVIFRLDFSRPSFRIIDAPGVVMKLLGEMGDDEYWPEFKDASATRTISVSAREEKSAVFRQFSVEPTALHFLMDCKGGVNLHTLLTDVNISPLFKGVHSLCEHFEISDFSRAGLRIIALSTIGAGRVSLLPKAVALVDSALIGNVRKTLGNVTDVGIAVDGQSDDKLGYHLRVGPYSHVEAQKYFDAEIAKGIVGADSRANFVADLDFFEVNFSMTVKASQWCKVPLDKAEKVLSAMSQSLAGG
jgi:hypothetical protein